MAGMAFQGGTPLGSSAIALTVRAPSEVRQPRLLVLAPRTTTLHTLFIKHLEIWRFLRFMHSIYMGNLLLWPKKASGCFGGQCASASSTVQHFRGHCRTRVPAWTTHIPRSHPGSYEGSTRAVTLVTLTTPDDCLHRMTHIWRRPRPPSKLPQRSNCYCRARTASLL